MLLQEQLPEQNELQRAITEAYLEPEQLAITQVLTLAILCLMIILKREIAI